MCGIAGLFQATGAVDLDAAARRMANELLHRGPDDEGVWLDPAHGLALAHRRLSIIDLSPQGHQPMHSASGRYVITYNGEIYNYEQIRAELAADGRAPPWRGHSDTEVLLAAIEAWGIESTLSRAVGMFAIALWDRDNGALTLARDRMGEKPLYYGITRRGFAFASELKALRALDREALVIDPQALAAFMQFGYVPAPHCIYGGLSKLPAGHMVRVGRGDTNARSRPYWQLGCGTQLELAVHLAAKNDAELVDMLHDRLRDAVGLQMIADVPLGAFLSGGIDSSVVVALMQAQSRQPVRTFTIGFHEKAFDEAPYAKAVAEHLRTDHTELYVSAKDAEAVIPELPLIYDEPFADSSQIPTTLVARLTRKHVTVSLSGDGGDELFAGYPRYAFAELLWKRLDRIPVALRSSASHLLRLASPRAWDRAIAVAASSHRATVNGHRVHRLAGLLEAQTLGDMYVRLMSQWSPEERLVLGATPSFDTGIPWVALGTPVQQMRRWDARQYLPDDLLVKVDRAAMSASLESRAPLLDHRVAELAFALPERMLLRAGQGKWILRRVLDRYVPRALIERPKTGFSIPIAQWLRGPLRAWASDLLGAASVRAAGLLDAGQVDAMWGQHISGNFDRSAYLWNVLMFQAWYAEDGRHAKAQVMPPAVVDVPALAAP